MIPKRRRMAKVFSRIRPTRFSPHWSQVVRSGSSTPYASAHVQHVAPRNKRPAIHVRDNRKSHRQDIDDQDTDEKPPPTKTYGR